MTEKKPIPVITLAAKRKEKTVWYCAMGRDHGCRLNNEGWCNGFICQYKVQEWTSREERP